MMQRGRSWGALVIQQVPPGSSHCREPSRLGTDSRAPRGPSEQTLSSPCKDAEPHAWPWGCSCSALGGQDQWSGIFQESLHQGAPSSYKTPLSSWATRRGSPFQLLSAPGHPDPEVLGFSTS